MSGRARPERARGVWTSPVVARLDEAQRSEATEEASSRGGTGGWSARQVTGARLRARSGDRSRKVGLPTLRSFCSYGLFRSTSEVSAVEGWHPDPSGDTASRRLGHDVAVQRPPREKELQQRQRRHAPASGVRAHQGARGEIGTRYDRPRTVRRRGQRHRPCRDRRPGPATD